MADQTLDQLPEQLTADDADLLYAVRGGTDIKVKRGVLVTGRVPESRAVNTANGLKGGGPLTGNLGLELDVDGLLEDLAPNPTADFALTYDASAGLPRKVRIDRLPVTATGGEVTNSFSSIAVAGQSTVSADSSTDVLTLVNGANINITTNAATDTVTVTAIDIVPTSRNISAGAGLSGGGTLSSDRSLALNIFGQSEDLAPDLNADYVMVHKTSASALRKVRLSLLSGAAYQLPTASPSVLGGIKIGAGLSIDGNGLVTATSTYVLPAATPSTIGGIRPGTGLSVDGTGILTNLNSIPYALPVATVGTLGGVKAGTGVSIAQDGTLTVEASSGGVSDGAYRPEVYGVIRGTGLSAAQRQNNAISITACWAAAGAAKGRVDMGAGVFEIEGTVSVTHSGFTITGDWCSLRQFATNVSIVAVTAVSQVIFKGFNLTYQTSQTAGDNPTASETYVAALRLSSVSNCNFENIDTSNAWVGLGISSGPGSYNNTFNNIKMNMISGNGYGLVHKTGSGSAFINCRITGNGTVATTQGGVYLSGLSQTHFTQLTVEFLLCRRPVWINTCPVVTFSGSVFNALTPTAVNGYGGLVHLTNGTGGQFAGVVISNTALNNTTQAITDASIFTGEFGANALVTNIWVTNTIKTGTVRFALLGHSSSAPARNVVGVFQQVRLNTDAGAPHRIDDLCYASVDPLSDSLDGPLLSYNSSIGSATGGLINLGDESATVFSVIHGRLVRINAGLTANQTITLSQYVDKPYANATLNAPRASRGATMRIERTTAATGAFLVTVANHNGAALTTLTSGTLADFLFDGTNWVLQAATSGGGGGGTGGTFATQAEAEAGTSSTTYMSPLRTLEAFTSYAAANEISGTEGQVVGFSTTGDAVIVKNTRTMMIPLVADATALVAGTSIRNIKMALGLKLTSVQLYTPTIGTTATTVDINLNGSSIFATPPTIASNSNSVTHTVFATSTLSLGGILTFDLDAAGTGAKGLQVTLLGVEV